MIQEVLLGVIANGLTALIAPAFRDEKKATLLHPIIRKAIVGVADEEQWSGPPRLEEVCLFLTSPETEAIIRQIYATKLSNGKSQTSSSLIREEFIVLFAFHFNLKKSKVPSQVHSLFDSLMDGCDRALNAAIDNGVLSAHEAKSAFRHRQLVDEIAGIQKNVDFLTARYKPDLQAVLDFEQKYRCQIADRHERITPPNFDSARKLAINDIYVSPHFIRQYKTERSVAPEAESLKIQPFLSGIHRVVLLGNPGGGKSTFSNKLCYDLSSRYSDRLFAGRQVTPIPVILRDYGVEKKTHNYSILQFIEATANSSYQLPPPYGAFEYMLLNGRALIIFDGLDELLDTNYRQKITADVESFCNLYPSVPVLVTSREVGYDQAPLDSKKFETYRLAPFDDAQIEEYVTKWFVADSDLTPPQQAQKTESFLRESAIVPDLRSNPLMLALMCNIYRGENYIPQNRPDLYEKCAVMLFERWDKSRGILAPVPFEAHLRPAMMYLAHWIFTNAVLQGGVSEDKLIDKTADYLVQRLYDDRDEAESSARDFIAFCKGRAWVFTDTGAGLYQFTHRTFLEYFTAFHLVRKQRTPEALAEILIPRIAKREWDSVAQLAVQLQDKHSEGAGDEFLGILLEQIHKDEFDVRTWNLMYFAARCLQFIVPSPTVRRKIAEISYEQFLSTSGKRGTANHRDSALSSLSSFVEPLSELLACSNENRATIAHTVEGLLTTAIQHGTESRSAAAVELVNFLAFPLEIRSPPRMLELVKLWHEISEKILANCAARIQKLYAKDVDVCVMGYYRREVDIENLVRWHELPAIFDERTTKILQLHRSPLYFLLAHSGDPEDWYNEQFAQLGGILLKTDPPWFTWTLHRSPFFRRYLQVAAERISVPHKLSSDSVFGILIVWAVAIEEVRALREALKKLESRVNPFFELLLSARFEPQNDRVIQQALDRYGFTGEQQSLILKWIRGEINFTNKPLRRERLKKPRPTIARKK